MLLAGMLVCMFPIGQLIAEVLRVLPSDDAHAAIARIEHATAGDIVEVGPGTYRFRISLEQRGTAEKSIIIRALDPKDRPVWDLSGKDCGDWPGSYAGGDKARGAWQVRGWHYQISDIIIRGSSIRSGQLQGESAGMRMRGSSNVTVRNCLIEANDNGISGDGRDIVYEACEIRGNGHRGGDRTHNAYIHGGTLTLRFCYIHDPTDGQNLHLRATDALVAYCRIENGRTYMGDLMTNMVDRSRGGPIVQTLTLLGNLIIEGQSPENDAQVLTMYNDYRWPRTTMRINMFHNTFIGNGKNEALVHLTDSGIDAQDVCLYNNIFWGNHIPIRADIAGGIKVDARNNWWPVGHDYSGSQAYMSASVIGETPGFVSPSTGDYRLLVSSPCRGKADAKLGMQPEFEFFLDTGAIRRHDSSSLGAFRVAE